MTHPFHPAHGQRFEVLDRRRRFGEDSILALGADGQLTRLAAAWTSVAVRDPFVEIANRRTLFCPTDLHELRRLLDTVAAASRPARAGDGGPEVKGK